MCNFYMMYYTKNSTVLNNNVCMSYGPPLWYFKDFIDSKGDRLDSFKIPETINQVPEEQKKELATSKPHHHEKSKSMSHVHH
jgi:hypothetical protein